MEMNAVLDQLSAAWILMETSKHCHQLHVSQFTDDRLQLNHHILNIMQSLVLVLSLLQPVTHTVEHLSCSATAIVCIQIINYIYNKRRTDEMSVCFMRGYSCVPHIQLN